MRAAARRIMDQFAPDQAASAEPADLSKINALEAPYESAREVIPDVWTPEHVGKRIVEAFETLDQLPPDRGPRAPGNNWPQHVYDPKEGGVEAAISIAEERRQHQSRARPRPTSIDLQRMDIVFEWLAHLHAVDDGLCRILQRWARLRARGRSIKEWCRRTDLSFQVFYRLRDKAVKIIVARLVSAGSPVW